MFIVRDVFYLKFGAFRNAYQLLQKAKQDNIMPNGDARILSDFTGHSYRLIFENQYESLAAFETELSEGMKKSEWQQWYVNFKEHVESSSREILKLHKL